MAIPAQAPTLTIEACERKMLELQQLAPGHSFKDFATVRNRHGRSSVPRDDFTRALEIAKRVKLQEYEREAQCHAIDGQWLDLSKLRAQLRLLARRKRPNTAAEARQPRRPRFGTQPDNCTVCQSALAVGAVSDLPCGHQLHSTCLAEMVMNGRTICPYNCIEPLVRVEARADEAMALEDEEGSYRVQLMLPDETTRAVDLMHDATVRDLSYEIGGHYFHYMGRVLSDESSLVAQGVVEGSTIRAVPSGIRGCYSTLLYSTLTFFFILITFLF